MHDFSPFLALLTPTSALFPSHRGLPLTPEGKVPVKLTLPGTSPSGFPGPARQKQPAGARRAIAQSPPESPTGSRRAPFRESAVLDHERVSLRSLLPHPQKHAFVTT